MPTAPRTAPDDPLARYRAERDPGRTPEPAGEAPRHRGAPAAALRFVVHRHAARRLHWDLRLALDGVLKSWAVTKEPSLDPAVKRLAVQVEDHPLGYAAFEGTIPAGSYGAGAVEIWDGGVWRPDSVAAARAGLAAGRLDFALEGRRLSGRFRLVRMREEAGPKRHHWLLMKVREAGDEAAPTGTVPRRARAAAAAAARMDTEAAPRRAPRGHRRAPAAAAAAGPEDHAAPPRLTHPERVLWPEAGVTKGDLADWLRAAAPRLLPQVAGRVLTLVRAPRGLGPRCPRFVQRHPAAAFGPAVRPARIPGEAEPYLTIADEAGLVALAQADVVEVHATGARLAAFDRPDRLVLDLDPAEGLGFAAVVSAAHDLRARVEALGLTAFPRTTGGKGLHLVVPLVPRADWAAAKALARALCEAAAADAPGRYTTSPVRRVRAGRIFLDYLRNGRLATAVAGFSPRAKPAATVAVPLAWDEVADALDPAAFTLRTALARLALPDPWADLDAAAKPITPALLRRAGATAAA